MHHDTPDKFNANKTRLSLVSRTQSIAKMSRSPNKASSLTFKYQCDCYYNVQTGNDSYEVLNTNDIQTSIIWRVTNVYTCGDH